MARLPDIAVVIPCYNVRDSIISVIQEIGNEVRKIYVVDDACPQNSGALVRKTFSDNRILVLAHEVNQGVGGATITGYRQALSDGMEIIVKLDGDGQMKPSLVSEIARPVIEGYADYSKGNRFDSLDSLLEMPKIRIFGNAILSLCSKVSSGFWSVTDPTNGYTAIHANALKLVNLDKIRKNYFFESDMLFRLAIANCVVVDVPMDAVYGNEKSNLRISKILWEFPWRYLVNLAKRVFYRYYLREWSLASLELPMGLSMMGFGIWFGTFSYISASEVGKATSAGQVTASAVAIILGVQLLLSFLAYDIQSEPRIPRHRKRT